MNPVTQLFRTLASLKLTVILLAMSIFLIFAGTWAQIDLGIWTVLSKYFRSFFVMIPFQIFLPREWDVPGAIPYPGGFTLGGLLFINLLTAHAVRFKWEKRRTGIILVHLGIVLLIVGEFLTAMLAQENNMTIREGGTADYAEDIREVELAVVDRSNTTVDKVVVVPQSMLARQKLITDPRLPFDIQVDQFHQNADLLEGAEGGGAPLVADKGFAVARHLTIKPRPPAAGTDRDRSDFPTAYVTLKKDGAVLGTWLVSLYLSLMSERVIQPVMVDGRTYDIAIRFKREYKPYQLTLIDFRHDKYPGTETPMNYSSDVRLFDPTTGEDRQVRIFMNNPLRYRGETFYQASFLQGDTGTVLQVVKNPGWLLPYAACAIGALGLLIHFGTRLVGFLNKGRKT
ncbi:MAG: hypothetical protein FD129_541 [bacterium]|nr:MAG: hypothetical protein FD129_541 [bacterium]